MLIPNWRKAHRLWSVRLGAVMVAISGLDWLVPTLADMVPKGVYFALAVAVVVARVVVQKGGHSE